MSEFNWYNTDNWYAAERAAEAERREAPAPAKKKKKKGARRWPMIVGLCLLALLLVGSSLLFSDGKPEEHSGAGVFSDGDGLPRDPASFFREYFDEAENDYTNSQLERTALHPEFRLDFRPEAEDLSLTELYERCAPSIVSIETESSDGTWYWGSGTILSADGLILVNCHQVDDAVSAQITLGDGRSFDAKLVGADPLTDLAVLWIDADGLPAAEFGDSGLLKVGQEVAAIGNPLSENFRGSLTNGIISALDRSMPYEGHTLHLLQTNTAINGGSSGGALFNRAGQVVGITNMKMYSYYSGIEGMSLAIPSATVKRVVNDLVSEGRVTGRTAIGITVGPVPYEATVKYGMPEGLYVSDVSNGSDAKAQGIREGDVITEINGQHVSSTDEVSDIKDAMKVGDTLSITVWRDGETHVVAVKLMPYEDLYG